MGSRLHQPDFVEENKDQILDLDSSFLAIYNKPLAYLTIKGRRRNSYGHTTICCNLQLSEVADENSIPKLKGGGVHPVFLPTVQPRPYLVNFWLNFAKLPKHAQICPIYCMQDTFTRATHSAKRARDDRVSCIQPNLWAKIYNICCVCPNMGI